MEGGESLIQDTRGRVPARGRSEAKARLIASEWERLGLDAAAFGEAEWRLLGRPFLQSLVDSGYPATAANLVCEEGARPLPAARLIERQGRSIGVIAVTEGAPEGCVVTEPTAAIEEARALLPDTVDAVVLLWPTRGERAHSAALRGLDVDFIVDGSGRFSKGGEAQLAGRAWLVGTGTQTKAVARLALTPGTERVFLPPGFEERLPARRTDLARRLEKAKERLKTSDTAVVRGQVKSLETRLAQLDATLDAATSGAAGRYAYSVTMLDDAIPGNAEVQARVDEVKASFAGLADASPSELLGRPLKAPEGSAFAGAEACRGCHPDETAQWRKTPHARAYTALIRGNDHLDDNCFSCHVTGAVGENPSITSPDTVGGMLHVQCEACHGPSAAHVADPTVKPVRSPAEATCRTCHDGERDQGQFDLSTYLPQVRHGSVDER